jgi:hypothetical protein
VVVQDEVNDMRVQVTKDAWGVSIYHADIELVFTRLDYTPAAIAGRANRERKTRKGKEPVWIPERVSWFRRSKVVSDKFVKKHFPDLGSDMAAGDIQNMDLTLTRG